MVKVAIFLLNFHGATGNVMNERRIAYEESNAIRRIIRLLATGSDVRDPTHMRSLSIANIVDDVSKAGFEITDKYTFSYHPAIRSLDRIIPFIGPKITTNAIIRGIKLDR